jgi:hypothetical protein
MGLLTGSVHIKLTGDSLSLESSLGKASNLTKKFGEDSQQSGKKVEKIIGKQKW